MKFPFHPAIAKALKLTREGDLKSATAAIQDMLGGNSTPGEAKFPNSQIIDVAARSVPPKSSHVFASVEPSGTAEVERSAPSFTQESFSGVNGALGYWLYKPATVKPGMPLVVMLHGCTQSPQDFARGTGMNMLAEEMGFIVAYPKQERAANAQKCWNWFSPVHQKRGSGEPALIAGLTRQIIAEEAIDASRVYVAGLSAGGAAAAIMSTAYPEVYAAVGIHSGLACGAAKDLPSALIAMQKGPGRTSKLDVGRFVPVITFHGDQDTTVHEVNSREIVRGASKAARETLKVVINKGEIGGRAYTQELGIDPYGVAVTEQWTVHGAGHAWSGGNPSGTYADSTGPDASREMLRFFLGHHLPG